MEEPARTRRTAAGASPSKRTTSRRKATAAGSFAVRSSKSRMERHQPSSSPPPPAPSKRYNRLVEVIDKVMTQSRKQIDVNDAIRECYGEDASIFQLDDGVGEDSKHDDESDEINNSGSGGSNGVLQSLVVNVLDRVEEHVVEQMTKLLREQRVEQRLSQLEKIVFDLDTQAERRQQAEIDDQMSARRAIEEAKVSTAESESDEADSGDSAGEPVPPSNLIAHAAYQELLRERQAVLEEIQKVESDIANLEERGRSVSGQIRDSLEKVESEGTQLEKSADICSMVS